MLPIYRKFHLAKEKKDKILQEREYFSEIFQLLNELKKVINDAQKERLETGMAHICAQCAMESKPCCGSEIENKYSVELLTINLLLGISFPTKEKIIEMCFFLTDRGCSLLARDVFCINFICEKIKSQLSPLRLKKLREFEGLQLNLQFKIEEMLKKI